MRNKIIFVACDTSKIKKIKDIILQTKNNKLKIIPKFGLQFFYSKNGRKFLEKFKKDFWLDLKINDIPQTAFSAIDLLWRRVTLFKSIEPSITSIDPVYSISELFP